MEKQINLIDEPNTYCSIGDDLRRVRQELNVEMDFRPSMNGILREIRVVQDLDMGLSFIAVS